ncbi:MAG: nicotinate (nicotinamide) nucleotide adenylyltransferase [Ignavibacteria bacterium GWF2_33_9]|nr:MAG: nicotinate (nicotinamide) nucleotide adenylyltransferase [Ignavibacteria bacterium GWF2_33_9]
MRKVGIYGGTFNPIHNGHLQIVNDFINDCNLDICFVVPNFISPFKTEEIKSISDEDRIQLIELAIQNISKLEIELFELNKKGISKTLDTINYFRQKFPDDELFLLVGSDTALEFHKWYKWKEIVNLVTIVIALRKNESKDFEFTKACKNCKVILLQNELIEISSSEIRELILLGENISSLVPAKTYIYIINNNLYK